MRAFQGLVGHEGARSILQRALAQQRLPPALLLVGPEGIGKRTLALAVARALLCEKGEGCGACSHCRRIEAGVPHPDLMLVEPSGTTKDGRERAKSEIKVEQVRSLVQQSFGRAFEAGARFFLIDDAHAMNPSSANSLLKSLEEPPATTHFALVSAAPQALLPTIRSRCQILRLQPLPFSLLERHLREQRGLQPDEARLRATLADGSLGRALAFESAVYRELREKALSLLESDGSPLSRLEHAESLSEAEDQLPLLLLALRSLLRDVAALRAGVPPAQLLNLDVAGRLAPLARGPLGAAAGELAERVADSLLAVQGNVSKQLEMDMLADAPELGTRG